MPTVERRYDSRATWDRASRAWQIITDWTISGVDASDSVTGLSVRYAGIPDTVIGMGGTYDAIFQKDDVVAGVNSVKDPVLAVDSAFAIWQHLNTY